jgi:hypothetical protein
MVLTMCSFYGRLFEPEDPGNPTREEIDIARKNAELARMGDELLDRLGKLHTTGDALIAPPPEEHFRRFWWEFLAERQRNGKAKKGAR